MLKNKKGIALNQAFGAVLTLVLVGVLVIIGILVFVNLNSGPFANVAAISSLSESVTPSGNGSVGFGGTFVSNASLCSFSNFAITTAANSTGVLLDSGNYSTSAAGLVSNTTTLTGGQGTGAPWIINSTGTWGSQACTASSDLITQFATYPTLVGLVGTIIFLGLVIGVLVASFVFGRKGGV